MLFDESVFQTQRIRFAGGDDVAEIFHMGEHCKHLFCLAGGCVEILANAVFEALSLADIQNVTIGIHHDVHAWLIW